MVSPFFKAVMVRFWNFCSVAGMALADTENKNRDILLYAVIAVGILAHLFSLAALPEAAYADSFYHVMLSQDVMAQGTLDLPLSQWAVPPPLYYLVFSSVFFLTGLPVDQYTIKLLPFFFAAVQLLLFFIVSRKIFGQGWRAPFALFAIFPLLIRYGSVNYTENLALIFVLACTFLVLRLRELKTEKTLFALLPVAVSVAALSISKLNGTVLVPIFMLAAAYFLLKNKTAPGTKNKASKTAVAVFLVLALLLSSLWFALNLYKFGLFDRFGGGEDIATVGRVMFGPFGNMPYFASTAYLFFWDFPPLYVLPAQLLPLLEAAFALLVLPLCIVLIAGTWLLLKRKKYFFLLLALVTSAGFAVMVISRTMGDAWYTRLLFPIVPFIAILFGYGWRELAERKFIGRLAMLSLILFSLYSLAFTSYTAFYYSNDHANNSPLYGRISMLPADAKVAIQPNLTKAVLFISGRDALGQDGRFDAETAQGMYGKLLAAGVTHIATVCRKDPWDKNQLLQLEAQGKIAEIFGEKCSALYEVQS